MADNYLEKKYDEVFGRGAGGRTISNRPSLDTLLLKNRSYRGYNKEYVVHRRQLDCIVGVNTKVASGMNAQRLRFHPVTKGEESDIVLRHIKLGAALPELHLPFPGTEPEAFIIVCCEGEESPILDIDLGISLQSMLLKAVEIGLGGIIVRNFNKPSLKEDLGLSLNPIAVLCIGKPAEKVELKAIRAGEDHNYYRADGVHVVPKIIIDDLIV